MSDINPATLLKRQLHSTLIFEIAEKNRQIREITEERDALQRLLERSRQQDELTQRVEVTRKNSINRVVVEGSILNFLANSGKPVRAKNLYRAARSSVINLNENTFRSHLHRMKEGGKIECPTRGMWQIASPKRPTAAQAQP
jgi:hypothetical protein